MLKAFIINELNNYYYKWISLQETKVLQIHGEMKKSKTHYEKKKKKKIILKDYITTTCIEYLCLESQKYWKCWN